jgi:hypothetical protein
MRMKKEEKKERGVRGSEGGCATAATAKGPPMIPVSLFQLFPHNTQNNHS